MSRGSIYTVGHSNHPAEKFLTLLRERGIEVVVDTRSYPYSRHAPRFNAHALEAALSRDGVAYLFLGSELGGRPREAEFYDDFGRVDYALVGCSRPFLDGISRLEKEIRARKVVLLCSEENPLGCHRRLLVGRALEEKGFTLRHIRGDGSVQVEGETNGGQPALFPRVGGETTDVYTIGFTKKTAPEFFGTLNDSDVKRLVDVRLKSASQLAGFARGTDLPFFLQKLCGTEYVPEPTIAPTREILDAYRNGGGWPAYEEAFLNLLRERRVEETLGRGLFDVSTVLLCSEAQPQHRHRRLVPEYLNREWGGIEAVHL